METLIYNLLAYINNSLDKDINYHIAKTLLENSHKIEGFSLETVAEVCNVAPSTINRFCKRIGFRNFSSLRNSVMKYGASLEKNDTALSGDSFIPRFPKNYNVVGGTTPKVLYNCDCFFVISPTRTALPGFSNASMTSNSSSNSCIV